MPSIQQILLGLEEITNTWIMVAILWHVFFGVLSISLAVGARPAQRAAGIMLALPTFSVSALAWITSNPFNGSVYALVGILLVYIAARLPRNPVDFAPWLAGITIAYAVVALCVYYTNLETMVIPGFSDSAFTIMGAILVVIGIVLWASGAAGILKAFREGKLVKGGIFAITRNPMYSGLVVFLIPGIALWLRSWPLLTVPIVAYIVFKRLIVEEEKYLEEKFGQEYLEYKSRVNSIIPHVRFR